jgi:(2Fe-2S) ferredoxin
MSKFARHFFVCQTERPPTGKPSCANRGAADIYAALLQGLGSHPDLWDQVAVTTSGCLGPCFDGPNLVVYPEGVWYAGVTPDDIPEIVESHMVGGVPVERLVYQWPDDDD